jgi:hypothetical protein
MGSRECVVKRTQKASEAGPGRFGIACWSQNCLLTFVGEQVSYMWDNQGA